TVLRTTNSWDCGCDSPSGSSATSTAAASHAAHRRRNPRILRPRVLRVTSLQLFTHLHIAAVPETGQVTCHLHWSLRRGEQLDQQRYRTAADARRVLHAKDFLQAHRH